MEITPEYRSLIPLIKKDLYPWRKYTIAVDGVDGSGKSTLSRFLAWQLGMPVIETDLYIAANGSEPKYHLEDLKKAVAARHNEGRPLIIEGIMVLNILEKINLTPDFLIYVDRDGHTGAITWEEMFGQYQKSYNSKEKASVVFNWKKGGG